MPRARRTRLEAHRLRPIRARAKRWTKSSRRSSASSKTNNHSLWVVDSDAYVHEHVRLALEGSEWDVVPLQSDREAAPATVLLISAAEMLTADSQRHFPPGVPILLHGDPGWIPAVSDIRFDDYLAHPWTREELLFRLRRVAGGQSVDCRCGSFSWGRYWVAATGVDSVRVSVPLTPAQFTVLDLLARYAGENVPRETMLAGLPKAQEGGRALDMHVSRLRLRIADVTAGWPESPRIRSRRSSGYCLEIV